jgi:hypothetical protein
LVADTRQLPFDPPAVLPDQAGIDKNKHLSQVKQLFLDAPVKVHAASNKKIPGSKIDPGIPCFILKICGKPQSAKAALPRSGRSSDLRIILLAAPSRPNMPCMFGVSGLLSFVY